MLISACASFQPMGPPAGTAAHLTADSFVTADGVALPLRRWAPAGPPRAVILALHGMNDYSNAFAGPGSAFAAQGIETYAYDQRGFGASPRPGIWPTTTTLTADLCTAAALVRARHPGVPLYILGESMGGAVVMTAMTDPPPGMAPPPVAGVILAAPAVWARATMPAYQRVALWLGDHALPWATVTAPRSLKIWPSDNIPMLRALGQDPLVIKRTRIDTVDGLVTLMDHALAGAPALTTPGLVLYGLHEQVIPHGPITRLLASLPPGRQTVAIYDQGYHMLLRDLHSKVVTDDILAWIGDPRAPLPSGADRRAWPGDGPHPDMPGATVTAARG